MRFEIGECQDNRRFGGSASADMAALGQWRQLAQSVKERFELLIGGKVKADSLLGGAHDLTRYLRSHHLRSRILLAAR